MTATFEAFLHTLVTDADGSGYEIVPEHLIACILKYSQPIDMLCSEDAIRTASEAFYQDFSFIAQSLASKQIPPTVQIDSWKGLLRFLFRGLRAWKVEDDPQCHHLAVFLLVADIALPDGVFWHICPAGIEQNIELRNQLSTTLSGVRVDIANAIPPNTPIWEREAFQQFIQADNAEDWLALSELIPKFRNAIRPPVILGSMTRCLQRLDALQLAALSGAITDITSAMFMSTMLHPGHRLELALNSTSTRVKFACVFGVVTEPSFKLTPTGQTLLTNTLIKISQNLKHWDGWMRAFNKFPSRYMELQVPLGEALSNTSLDVIQRYVDSHEKAPALDAARIAVSNCLRAFGARASPTQRLLLWESAFRQWEVWISDVANADGNLTDIARNVLDYAVVGFLVESMTETAATSEKNKISAAYLSTVQEWHPSVVDFNTVKNRRLSQYQLYAHAESCRTTPTDFLGSIKYFVIDPTSQQYLAAMLLDG